jgi:hypothetical protein
MESSFAWGLLPHVGVGLYGRGRHILIWFIEMRPFASRYIPHYLQF